MKIIEAINHVDELKPNTFPQEMKVAWLSVLDGKIKRNIFDTHEPGNTGFLPSSFNGYDENTSLETVLLAKSPYDAMYLYWLEANIDQVNGEYDRYNASIMLFNVEYEAFETDYHRRHKPKGGGRFLW